MSISLSQCMQAQPLVNFSDGLINMDQLIIPRHHRKHKVVLVMGVTGSGKSRLAIELATRFNGEVINSDKIQVYKGLDIITNKVTEEESKGVPHHLLGIVDPDTDFTADDFVYHASTVVDTIIKKNRLPIIAGGSNSFIKALVNDNAFRSKYEICFLWVDVSMPVLHTSVSKRVDLMVNAGLVEEAKGFFEPDGDYTRGIRRAIGVPEMDQYFRNECGVDGEARARLLERAIDEIKSNTCKLACRQLENILSLTKQLGWRLHRLDATEVFLKHGVEAKETLERLVFGPSTRIVGQFLCKDHVEFMM